MTMIVTTTMIVSKMIVNIVMTITIDHNIDIIIIITFDCHDHNHHDHPHDHDLYQLGHVSIHHQVQESRLVSKEELLYQRKMELQKMRTTVVVVVVKIMTTLTTTTLSPSISLRTRRSDLPNCSISSALKSKVNENFSNEKCHQNHPSDHYLQLMGHL